MICPEGLTRSHGAPELRTSELPTWQHVVEFSRFPQSSYSCLQVFPLSSWSVIHLTVSINLTFIWLKNIQLIWMKFHQPRVKPKSSAGQPRCPCFTRSSGAHLRPVNVQASHAPVQLFFALATWVPLISSSLSAKDTDPEILSSQTWLD